MKLTMKACGKQRTIDTGRSKEYNLKKIVGLGAVVVITAGAKYLMSKVK